MGHFKFEDAVAYPDDMCPDCANIIGAVNIHGNSPHKHEGAGISLKPQWFSSSPDETSHATFSFQYLLRSHTDPEHAKRFVVDTKHHQIRLCELGRQLPTVHVSRQPHDEKTLREIVSEGAPRVLQIDGDKWCKYCNTHQTFAAYADGSWVSPVEACTNPECVKNGGPVDQWQQHIDNGVICGVCDQRTPCEHNTAEKGVQ